MVNDGATIEVEQLQKTYREGWVFKKNLDALRGVTLRVEAGEVFGLLGPNGAGKTTFIKILLGIIRKTGGTASLLGLPAGSPQSRRRVGYLPEHLRMAPYHTAMTALEYYGRLSGLSYRDIRARSGKMLDRVGLTGRTNESIKRYSKGMLQRLGLAQALLHEPDVMILDEPTDGLDPVGRADVRRVLAELQSLGTTVFLNSHLLQEVELICDRVAILQRGKVRFLGAVDQLTSGRETHHELEFVLAGDLELIRKLMGEKDVSHWEQVSENTVRLVTRAASQTAVDELIDRLRVERVSIISLTPRRVTLEDAFLSLLSETEVQA
jgi:ABC-2 type transport system ATP-binding protein